MRRKQPYTIAVSRKTGKETYYHTRPGCQKQGVQQTSAQLKGGEAYDLYSGVAGIREYNSSLLGPGLPPEVRPMTENGERK